MQALIRLFALLPILFVSACGPTGDTEALKQDIEKNKLSIVSVVIKPQYTRTLAPLSASPANPKYYFEHNDTEQLQAFGITESNDEILLSTVSWTITDNSSTAGATTINTSGLLSTQALGASQIKELAVNVDFAGLTASADVVISSYPLTAGGLTLKINDAVVTSQAIPVCDTAVLKAEGLFDDGSTRDVTSKINWSAALADVNAKFISSDLNSPTFSAHTNATYIVTPDYKGQGTATMNFVASDTGFTNFDIDSSSVSILTDDTHAFSVTADINRGSGSTHKDVTTRAKWSSADKKVFTVSDSGVVTGIDTGGPIDVSAQCGSATVTASVTVNVEQTITSVEIVDEDLSSIILKTLTVGDSVKLKLLAHKKDTGTQDITTAEDTDWKITLIADKGDPITVDNDENKGLITATAIGTAAVDATYKDLKATLIVEVIPN